MTRLTNDLRNDIFRRIMKGLPNRDYQVEIVDVVQNAVVQHMDPKVRAVYDDTNLRRLLEQSDLRISHGSKYLYCYAGGERGRIIGLSNTLEIRTADYLLPDRVVEGTLYHDILFKTNFVSLVKAHYTQEELRDQVSRRLRANLAAATTIKKLYDVLEPELHGFIPKDVGGTSLLPACVAPVVDDLKKLGLVVPEVPKAVA